MEAVVYMQVGVFCTITCAGPSGIAGAGGSRPTVNETMLEVPVPQVFEGATVIFPLVDPIVTLTEFVPCPDDNTDPAGKLQV